MATRKQQSHNMYTVGLITALPRELAAMIAVLDEKHDTPRGFEKHQRDDNHYVWGQIGAHSVVIVSLPSGIYGKVSAATTAAQFLSSFPGIRLGLMVGIGAGIPRGAFDVRLGDVVVSKPMGESSGVVQYDLGKIQKDGFFHRVGFLAAPPNFLLTALGKLEAENILQGSQVPNILLEMIQRYPALAKPINNGIPYVYQGAHNDRLFSASSTHVELDSHENDTRIMHAGQRVDDVFRNTWHLLNLMLAGLKWLIWFLIASPLNIINTTTHRSAASRGTAGMQATLQREVCASCDSSKEIKRQPRSSTEPVIHYGVIASGDSVVKDGVSRDKILRRIDSNCICFEMESAGLMRTFPCMVVRGVCDYADTHKNDRWQNYAAAAAAAYAKELLLHVDPVDVLQAPNIQKVMEELTNKVSAIASATEETKRDIQGLKKSSLNEKAEKWISAVEISTVHHTTKRLRYKDTGQWLLQNDDYLSWKGASKSSFWLYGKPGSGKTVLSSTIIEDLKVSKTSPRDAVLYFYFGFNDSRRQSLDDAIRSLIHQLYCQSDVAANAIDSLLASEDNRAKQADTEFLCDVFNTMIRGSGGACIVLDALDECQTREDFSENQGLLSWIKGLIDSEINLRVLVTSRPEHDIKSTLGNTVKRGVDLSGPMVNRDIEVYVSGSLRNHNGLKRWNEDKHERLREQIKRNLMANADGMFRWVYCQLHDLGACHSSSAVQKQLEALPRTLADTYAGILRRIPEHSKAQVIRLLQFLVYSKGPLLIRQAVDALAVELERKPRFDPRNRMPVPEEISCHCSSLVIINDRSEVYGENEKEVQLAHATVKEYLLSEKLSQDVSSIFSDSLSVSGANISITEICLAYLLDVAATMSPSSGSFGNMYPLVTYAATYWMEHAAQADIPRVTALFQEFIDSREALDAFYLYNHHIRFREHPSILLLMATQGLTWAVQALLDKKPIDAKRWWHWFDSESNFENPLTAAIRENHKDIFSLLILKGADVQRDAVLHASARGDLELVRTLLSRVSSYGVQQCCDGAIKAACDNGHLDILHMALRRCADFPVRNHNYAEYLATAFEHGHHDIVTALFDISLDATFYDASLLSACHRGHYDLAKTLLLEYGANANASVDRSSALARATEIGHVKLVGLLLDNGANPDTESLLTSVKTNNEEILQMLLEYGANPDAVCGYSVSGTPFLQACYQGNENMVRLFLTAGVDMNAHHGSYGTACDYAFRRGHYNIIDILDEHGVRRDSLGYMVWLARKRKHEVLVDGSA